ncbi:unnamed protein product [Lactuca saligna]|uniref:Uncharacterized protein n=1 Tax=Lactuca saligna TaxID=75948 RepID=A0AA35Z824_LACSI|nr:unnamed protein product [Lactuca saligna]
MHARVCWVALGGRGNVGFSGPTSPSQPTVGVVSPVRLPIPAPSDEETESDDAGLRPRKVRMIVFVARLLGGIGVFLVWAHLKVLFSRASLPGWRNRNLISPLAFQVYAPNWAIGMDSILSEETATQEWSYAHPDHNEFACEPVKLSILLWPARRSLWKIMWPLWRTDQSDLKIHVSSLTLEKGVLASELARICQRDLRFRKTCGALGFEKGIQLGGCSTIASESGVSDHGYIARSAKEVVAALSSLVETDFEGLFLLGKLDYDSLRQFCCGLSPGGSSSDSEG